MITFADYMERLLYGPDGYYASGAAKSGKSGDYFTAPDVGPVFGQLLATIFAEWQQKMGADDFQLVEVGAGEGRLAKDILAARVFPYVAVERSPVRRSFLEPIRKEYPSFSVGSDLKALGGFSGVLFSNELIDAFPVHRVQFKKGRFSELVVEEEGYRRRFVWKEPTTPRLEAYFKRLGITFPDGYETEVNLGMADWLEDAARVLKKGLIVFIDYGRPAHEYYAPERTRGTLRAFSKHKVSADFLDPAGMVDLTADVDFTSLALDARERGFTPLAFMEMGTFLMEGVEKIVGAGHRARPPFESETNFGQGQCPAPTAGLKYLLHPEGLGTAFHVLVLGKEVDAKDWAFEHNRIARLGL